MGRKGDKHTSEVQAAADSLVASISSLGDVTSKKMFGGHGIFHEGTMFGIIDSSGKAFFKSNEFLIDRFEAAGSEKHGRMPYFSIPESVLNNQSELIEWANTAIRGSKG
ncbi:MAG: TfoX/Sxy family protein [Pyrinomonadaceae bacterium]|nr:TfoX/Sxy family protein [Pyrinomonadaceae bacterium]